MFKFADKNVILMNSRSGTTGSEVGEIRVAGLVGEIGILGEVFTLI